MINPEVQNMGNFEPDVSNPWFDPTQPKGRERIYPHFNNGDKLGLVGATVTLGLAVGLLVGLPLMKATDPDLQVFGTMVPAAVGLVGGIYSATRMDRQQTEK